MHGPGRAFSHPHADKTLPFASWDVPAPIKWDAPLEVNPFGETAEESIAGINRNIKAAQSAMTMERQFSHEDDYFHRKGPMQKPPPVEVGPHIVGGGGYKGRHHRMEMALRQAMNIQMMKMWRQWDEWCAELRRQRFMVNGCLNRMKHRQLSMAWERWQEWYTEMKDQQFRLAGAIRRMMNRQLSMAWERSSLP